MARKIVAKEQLAQLAQLAPALNEITSYVASVNGTPAEISELRRLMTVMARDLTEAAIRLDSFEVLSRRRMLVQHAENIAFAQSMMRDTLHGNPPLASMMNVAKTLCDLAEETSK